MQSSMTKQSAGALHDGSASLQKAEDPDSLGDISLMTPVAATFWGQTTRLAAHHWLKLSQDNALLGRAIAHTTLVVVAVLVMTFSNLGLSWGQIKAIHPLKQNVASLPASPVPPPQENAPLTLPAQLINTQDGILVRAAVPRTIIPDRTAIVTPNQTEIRRYVVESGDTISGIAAKFSLSPDTIIWSNPDLEKNPDWLSVGQQLLVLPVDGVYHQVGGGDTIEGIAGTYKTDPDLIIDHPLNQLDPENLVIQAGQWLVVPGGSKPFVPRTVTAYSGPVPENALAGTGSFGWPASGSISNGFFSWHPGIDIAGWTGAPILAADSGYVVVSGWDNLYGYHVVIDHSNGFQTLYAHLDSYYVEAGDNISQGQQIGEMGSTGNSTGPHLHFEIRDGTIQRNPYGFLP
jgi:murein DD-endopeptidase MepM/ murein hydrolase activator NlpD